MAITGGGSGIGQANNKVSSTSIVITLGVAASIGHLHVLWCVTDNFGTTDVADTTEHSSINDSKGNTWTKIREVRNANGAAAGGVTLSIWYSVNTIAYASLDTIQLNLANAVTAKAMAIDQFNISGGTSISSVAAPPFEFNDALDPPALASNSSFPGGVTEMLLYRAIGGEGVAAALTITSTWSLGSSGSATSGGSATANVALQSEFKITSSLPQTSNPTWQAIDGASIMAHLYQTPVAASATVKSQYVVGQAIIRGLTRCQKLTKRKSGLFVPSEWEEKILVPA